MYLYLLFRNNKACFQKLSPKIIDKLNFRPLECYDIGLFDVGTMLRVKELNVKKPAFAQQNNNSNAKGFL